MSKMKKTRWSKKDDDFLIENYSKLKLAKIAAALQRSEDSIRWRAHSLGITNEKPTWNNDQRAFVSSNMDKMSYEEMAKLTGKPIRSIKRLVGLIKMTARMKSMSSVDTSVIRYDRPLSSGKAAEHRALLAAMEIGGSYEYPESERATVNNQFQYFPDRMYVTKRLDDKTRGIWRLA